MRLPLGKEHKSCQRTSICPSPDRERYSQHVSRVWLTYWQDETFGLSWSIYEGVYAALGVASAIFTFAMGATMGIMAYYASNNLHREALENVFYSPMSVFETQPLGRILGVFGKDVDTIDNQLADSWRMLAMTLVSVRAADSVQIQADKLARGIGGDYNGVFPLFHCRVGEESARGSWRVADEQHTLCRGWILVSSISRV